MDIEAPLGTRSASYGVRAGNAWKAAPLSGGRRSSGRERCTQDATAVNWTFDTRLRKIAARTVRARQTAADQQQRDRLGCRRRPRTTARAADRRRNAGITGRTASERAA